MNDDQVYLFDEEEAQINIDESLPILTEFTVDKEEDFDGEVMLFLDLLDED